MEAAEMADEAESPKPSLEVYKGFRAHEALLNRATAEFERAALQPLFLLNGGAMVAFLTLLGAVAGKSQTNLDLAATKWALTVWSGGLLLAAFATAFGYLSQRQFARMSRLERQIVEAKLQDGSIPEILKLPDVYAAKARANKALGRARAFQLCAYISAVLSLVAFIVGAFRALVAVTSV
jgi:hypothetical protein